MSEEYVKRYISSLLELKIDSFQPFQSKLEGHSHIGYDLSHQERCKVVSRFVAHYTRVAWAVDPVDQGGRGVVYRGKDLHTHTTSIISI